MNLILSQVGLLVGSLRDTTTISSHSIIITIIIVVITIAIATHTSTTNASKGKQTNKIRKKVI